MCKFVQLHLHTDASLLDGVNSCKRVVQKAKEFGHPAVAITDHGNPANTYKFYKECKKEGIKPIIGLEFYITNDLKKRVPNKNRTLEDRDYHQSVYIKNKQGYVNYNYLTYMANTEGYYYKPRIDFDLLFERKEGLMVTSSCMASKIGNYIREGNHKDAETLFKKYLFEFGEDFYGEIQFNEVKGQKEINDFIIHLCKKYNVPTIIGGDVHYLNPEDNELQDAIIRSKRDADGADWVIDARKLYFHDVADYYKFNEELGWNYDVKLLETSFENSVKFADKVEFEFETGKYHVPKIDTGELSSKDYIEKVTWERLDSIIKLEQKYFPNKYSKKDIRELEIQAQYELEVIDNMGLNDYLLIVHDIINWTKKQGLYVGPGRGSAAGSTVAWALGITGLNPIEHGLMFERFINPQRKVMADIDWDNEKVSRDMILNYLIEKYGRDSVCNVPTFGTYGAKSALQSMSRGLRKDTGHDTILMKKIAKLEELNDIKLKWDGTKLVDYFKVLRDKTPDDEVRDWIDNNQDTIDFAQKIQGQMNNMGTHAGGIVVTPEPIYNFIPVTRSSSNLVAAYQESDGSAKDLGELGILKLDVLGLSTLDILKDCVENIKADTGVDLSEKIQFLDLEDKNLIDCFAKGDNYGVFQMERSKMFTSTFEKDGGPVDCFEDIVVINAMNRPGPLEKYLNKYGYWKGIDRGNIKLTPEKLEAVNKERYPFPFMEPILKPTHGAMLYQEQLMKIFCELTGLSFGDADSFRRAIGWTTTHPKYHTVAKYFDAVKDAMEKKGYNEKDIEFFIQYLRDFAGYSFNRSHALCYSYVSFQCLYFKYYYPAYFYAALINNANNIEKIQEIITFAKAEGIKVLPQSVKESIYLTKAVENTTIRLGFGMIKGMGDSTIEACNLFKTFPTMEELLKQKFKGLNKTQYQNLIDLGAFDDFKIDRKQVAILKDFYQDEDIEFWFTRKKQTLRLETIPETLAALFVPEKCLKIALNAKKAYDDALWDGEDELDEKPWVTLIKELVKDLKIEELDGKKYIKETSKKQKELMGFTLSDSGLASIDSTLRFKGVLPLKEYEDASKSYYFVVEKIEKALTKTGKTYLKLTLDGGIKAKCWRDIELIEGEIYYGNFKKDNFGFTLSDRDCYKAL